MLSPREQLEKDGSDGDASLSLGWDTNIQERTRSTTHCEVIHSSSVVSDVFQANDPHLNGET